MYESENSPKITVNPETGLVLDANDAACYYYGLPAARLKNHSLNEIGQMDLLTKLPNRQLFLDRLNQAVIESQRNQHIIALIFIDLDRFKPINDSLGHEAGDQVLIEVAHRLQVCIREEDTLARLGGDEFVVMLKDIQKISGIEQVVQKMLGVLTQAFPVKSTKVDIGGSLGIALFPQDADNGEDLLHKADLAMYRAKNNGRNQWAFFQAEMDHEAKQRHLVEKVTRETLDDSGFSLAFDPIYDVQDHREIPLYALEAKLAWQPEIAHAKIQIEDIVQLTETSHLGIALNQWQIHHALNLLDEHGSDSINLLLIVPVTQVHFRQKSFIEWLEQEVTSHATDPSSLMLSLTPACLNMDTLDVAQRIMQITDLGVQVMVNDFGHQGSSLFKMANFELTAIKLMDFNLSSSLAKLDRKGEKLASAIMAFAKALTPNVIGSGMLNAHQKSFMESQSCTLLQGLYLSEEVAEHELEVFLSRRQQKLYHKDDELDEALENYNEDDEDAV